MIKKCSYCGTVNMFNKTGFCKNCDRRLYDSSSGSFSPEASPAKTKANTTVKTEIIDCRVVLETTIKRFMDMTEIPRTSLKRGGEFSFNCQKNGEFKVAPVEDYNNVYISGYIYEETGKTKVSFTQHNDTTSKKAYIIRLIAYLAVSVFYGVFRLSPRIFVKPTLIDIIPFAIIIYIVISQALNFKNKRNSSKEDLSIMRGEIIKRIRAIEKWED